MFGHKKETIGQPEVITQVEYRTPTSAKLQIAFLSLGVIVLLVGLVFILYRDGYFTSLYNVSSGKEYNYLDNAQYTQRETMFEMTYLEHADIVFLGDSITQRGEWQEYYPGYVVANRGIDSDVTEGVLNRLDPVIDLQPQQIYLMIGINDIRQGVDESKTVANYAQILDTLKESLPECEIIIESVLPVRSTTGIDNKDVQALNLEIQRMADERNLTYIDIYNKLVDANNDLPTDYSMDGVHMTGAGYAIWLQALQAK